MVEFLIAIAAFLVVHIVPPVPPVRTRLISWLGRRGYLASYSLASLALLAWVVLAARRAPLIPLWDPAPWQALLPLVFMPIAIWLVLAGLAEPNPLSISLRATSSIDEIGPAAALTRHPVLWGFLLWAGSHVAPNGDVVSLVLFGGMALLAIGGFVASDRRARRQLGEERWRALAARTSLIPFAAIVSGRTRMKISGGLPFSMTAAIVVYLWFLLDGHERLVGPDPLAWLGS